jgi:hypothetical protein
MVKSGDRMYLGVRDMKKYNNNLIDRLGGIWFIISLGFIGWVLGIVLSLK